MGLGLCALSSSSDSLAAFHFLMQFVHAQGQQDSLGVLWPECTRFALYKGNKALTKWCLEEFERKLGPFLPSCDEVQCPPLCGRLGQVVESGGVNTYSRVRPPLLCFSRPCSPATLFNVVWHSSCRG
ncbi:hypothetical protein H6P81_021155 [Aristolochia fimbriata]|uniref:Uncharacterized protein n=1 Tax=Aristolochia fimbriata TaxID=158543 RepID=A0AAV7DTS1_ARIFI|nr:hypothetical protein H6P81_021155 [Aristolochia fimbriata]